MAKTGNERQKEHQARKREAKIAATAKANHLMFDGAIKSPVSDDAQAPKAIEKSAKHLITGNRALTEIYSRLAIATYSALDKVDTAPDDATRKRAMDVVEVLLERLKPFMPVWIRSMEPKAEEIAEVGRIVKAILPHLDDKGKAALKRQVDDFEKRISR